MGVCGVQYASDAAQYLASQEYTKLFLCVGGTGNGCINKPQPLLQNCYCKLLTNLKQATSVYGMKARWSQVGLTIPVICQK